MKTYEQQPKEGKEAYHAFSIYRDLGVERSLPQVAQQCAKSLPLMKRWSARYNWIERALAYDAEQDCIRTEATQKAIARATEKVVYQQEITAQRILNEQANIGFARVTDVISWEGVPGLVDSKELSDEAAATIESS